MDGGQLDVSGFDGYSTLQQQQQQQQQQSSGSNQSGQANLGIGMS